MLNTKTRRNNDELAIRGSRIGLLITPKLHCHAQKYILVNQEAISHHTCVPIYCNSITLSPFVPTHCISMPPLYFCTCLLHFHASIILLYLLAALPCPMLYFYSTPRNTPMHSCYTSSTPILIVTLLCLFCIPGLSHVTISS